MAVDCNCGLRRYKTLTNEMPGERNDFLARFLIKNSLVFEGNNCFCYMILSCVLLSFFKIFRGIYGCNGWS